MTLCIGSLARDEALQSCIVLGFDYRLSTEAWSTDSEYKLFVLNEQLVALYAGAPGRALELANIYQIALRDRPLTLSTALARLSKPLGRLKRAKAENYVRRRIGVSYREFMKRGESWYGQEEFSKRLRAIEDHDISVDFIIAGFIEKAAVLYQTVRAEDGGRDLEPCRTFCLIGTGAYTAEPALNLRTVEPRPPLARALYNVYEAKRTGEASPNVGKKTRMLILRRPERDSRATRVSYVTEAGEKWLRKLYGLYGPKTIRKWGDLPQDALRDGQALSSPISSSTDQT